MRQYHPPWLRSRSVCISRDILLVNAGKCTDFHDYKLLNKVRSEQKREEKPTQMSACSHNRLRQTLKTCNLFCSPSGPKKKQMFCWFPGIRQLHDCPSSPLTWLLWWVCKSELLKWLFAHIHADPCLCPWKGYWSLPHEFLFDISRWHCYWALIAPHGHTYSRAHKLERPNGRVLPSCFIYARVGSGQVFFLGP